MFGSAMSKKTLLDSKEIHIILQRLACQLIENHTNFENTVLIGLQPRGVFLAKRLVKILKTDYKIPNIQLGLLDITFYRDDFRRRDAPLEANKTSINFIVEDKNVVFIDDVLFSGRSIRAALTAIQSFGRPSGIELLVLIDRRFSRSLPIQPDYKGRQVDVINKEKVTVHWKENDLKDAVYLINN
jgi:pyrimidine operon attenuation protein/uracil phosphoribosyltransferase